MKLAYLLAQYLYTNKRLDLPGIGTFKLDPSILVDDNSRHRAATPDGITFECNASINDSPDLISYISAQAGKMKALAVADLESHLELAHQFLNIGKPFAFEGIGSLVKVKPGEFEFTPGSISERVKESADREVHGITKKENIDSKYQAYLATPPAKTSGKKALVVFLVLCGIGLAVWGGYTIATRNDGGGAEELVAETSLTMAVSDTAALPAMDTVKAKAPSNADNYKYVLEVAKETRAKNRYNQLKTNMWDVHLETADSVQYKLFLLLPATSDTTWKMDSLTALSGRRVYIEYQN